MDTIIQANPSEEPSDYMIGYSLSTFSGVYQARSFSSSSFDTDSENEEDDDDLPIDRYSCGNIDGELDSVVSWDQKSLLESIMNDLTTNSQGFTRLELEDRIEDVVDFTEAIRANETVRDVEIHIECLEGLTRLEQQNLADAICSLPELRSLLVYKNSAIFLQPLYNHRPRLLENLRLCKLDISEEDSIHLLGTTLGGLPNLRSLDIGFDCYDNQRILEALVSIKSVYVNLESFRLDYRVQANDNMLDDRMVLELAGAIQTSSSLKTISLPPYSCSEKCYEALIDMLHKNTVLERIDYWVRICNL